MKNKWLNNENINSGDTILDYKLQLMFPENVKQYYMTDAQIREFERIISNVTEDSSRCIKFFRDSVMINSRMYNICLSCGDVEINGEKFFLKGDDLSAMIKLKKKIRF